MTFINDIWLKKDIIISNIPYLFYNLNTLILTSCNMTNKIQNILQKYFKSLERNNTPGFFELSAATEF